MKTERFCPSLWIGNKNLPRSVASQKAPDLPMNTCHALKIVASTENIRVSAKIGTVDCRVTPHTPWIPISVNQT
jgi:hypothetical protein